ncbi:MAG: hypothetical protein HY077_11690 [Elusimicrobia bacterium]|nr:hypothetical protein [Elusimicrobiota bacterium]
MIDLAKLELRKGRDLFAGMAGIFLASLPLFSLIARMNHYSVLHALNATLLFWTVIGLPFVALLFGAYGGAALRHEPLLSAEEPLPSSPFQRVGAAALAGAAYLALMILLVLAAASLLSYDFRASLGAHEFARVFVIPYVPIEVFAILYGFLLAFVLAYLLGNSVGGGALALVLAGAVTGSLTRSFADHAIYGPRSPLWPCVVFVCAVCLAAAFKCLRRGAVWLERSENGGMLKGLKIAGILVAATFVSLFAGGVVEERTARSLQLAQAHYWIPWHSGARVPLPEPRGAALLEAVDGTLAWVAPEKGVALAVPRHDHTPHQILGGMFAYEIKGLAWDDRGRLWLMRRADSPGQWEVLSGRPGGRLELKAAFPAFEKRDAWLLVIGDCPVLETRESSDSPARFAEILGSSRLQWKPRDQVCRASRDPFATLDDGGTVLTQRKPDGSRRTWRLPGRDAFRGLKNRGLVEAAMFAGHPYFLVPVVLPRGRYGLAVCGEDGSVRLEWEMPGRWGWGFAFDVAPDGTVSDWFWKDERRHLLAATKDGRFLPPVAVEGLPSREAVPIERSVVHEAAGHAWILYDDRELIEIELAEGKAVHRWRLPDPQPMLVHNMKLVEAVEEGLFVRTSGALYFYDWQGRRRRVPL